MLVRLPIAWFVGVVMFVVNDLAIFYRGMEQFISAPLYGSIVTTASVVCLAIIGTPLTAPSIWAYWLRYWWIACLIGLAGLICIGTAWHPSFQENDYVNEWGAAIRGPHVWLVAIGYLLCLLSLLHMPVIGFSKDRRWW